MTYQAMSDSYRNAAERGRYEMAVREQAHLTYADSADPDEAGLANLVITGDMAAIDAVIAAICVGPNSAALGEDSDLTAAVQGAWPAVAGAYGSA
jgi:hypothetical protein